MFRVNHSSWWKEELPNQEEMQLGIEALKENNDKVDYYKIHNINVKLNKKDNVNEM